MRHPKWLLLLHAIACSGGYRTQPATTPAPAPAPAPLAVGVASITSEDVRRRIFLIADDSMRGRATPSAELEQMANYVAGEFRRLGLRPGGDSGAFIQRYPLEIYRALPESAGVWATGSAPMRWTLGQDMRLLQGHLAADHVAEGVVLITGTPQAGGTLDSATVTGKIAIVPIGASGFAGVTALLQRKPAAIIPVFGLPDSIWTRFPSREAEIIVRNPNAGSRPVLAVRDSATRPWLARLGVHLDSAKAAASGPLTASTLAGLTIHIALPRRLERQSGAPNVVGILEGSDPILMSEYVLFTGHMDHIGTPPDGQGCTAKGGDSICNGADDDGSGSVAVLELAEAFASATTRPKRSLVFMTVSGEERGLWGSAFFADHPTVPLTRIVANLNSDMVGRNWKDTMAVIGREHSDLGETLDQIAASHPELRITPVGDLWPQESLFFRSDHFNFAKQGIPILFFTSGLHPDYHQVSDSPDRIDVEKVARFIRLEYYLGEAVANAPQKPQWNPDSYKKIVQDEN